jgi:FtsZ-binding cell division protein ZapB
VLKIKVEELKESNDVLNNEVKELKESNVVLTKSNVVLKGKVEVLNNDVKELKESNAVLTKSNAVLTKSNVMLTGKVDVLNNDVKELKESNHIALSEVMNRLSLIEANSHLGSKTALRLLIFDIRKVMTDALGRSPLKNGDGSENWHTFISNITEQELMILKLDKKHIKLLTKQTWVHNIAMHVSNEAATAIAINALPDGDDKILWADLYLRAYKKKPNV